MRVACIQLEPRFGDRDGNMERAAEAVRRAAGAGVTLAILPELYPSGYAMTSRDEARELAEPIPGGPSVERLIALARETGCRLVMGLAEQHGERVYNSSVAVGPRGVLAVYRKLHLFQKELDWFDPGEARPPVADIGQARIGMMICFDWIFPEAARSLAIDGADVICHPSNLVLHFCQDAMVTRCIENRVFALTCNRIGREARGEQDLTFTGCSQITGLEGKVLARAAADREETIMADIDPSAARDKLATPRNDVLQQRRPEIYQR
ncbi:MAG: acyltransferase [Candidatus Eisenbacteria bacterium]|nr:acyltransferase [Candidatus Eisenbacteria bacterium]